VPYKTRKKREIGLDGESKTQKRAKKGNALKIPQIKRAKKKKGEEENREIDV